MLRLRLTPHAVLTGSTPAENIRPPSLFFSTVYGAASFAAVSGLAYSLWAWQLLPGAAAMYAAIAAIYIGLTGFALGRLVIGPDTTLRFALLFAAAFAAYAALWCALWFGLRGRHHADLWGAALGLAVMTLLIQRAFGDRKNFLPLFAVLFTCHSLGYYAGDVLHGLLRGTAGRLLWGVAHGAGFGAGLGYLLYEVQEPVRRRLRAL